MTETKEVLAARISYLIDDLLSDGALGERQRNELLRLRARFAAHVVGGATRARSTFTEVHERSPFASGPRL